MATYRPFLIRIGQPVDGAYPLTAEFQGLQATASIPGDLLRQCLVDHQATSRHVGTRLFAALFTGDVLRLHRTAVEWLGPNERLRIVLAQPLPEPLDRLPWELIFDAPGEPRSLTSATNPPLVRYAPAGATPHRPPSNGVLRVLAVTAFAPDRLPPGFPAADLARPPAPGDTLRIVAGDLRTAAVGDVWRRLLKGRRYRVTLLENATGDALREHLVAAEMAGNGYHVVHFFGQTSENGAFVLPDESGARSDMHAAELAELAVTESVTLLAITLCQEDAAPAAIRHLADEATRRGVPAVIGMHALRFDRAVIDFSREFYRALAAGEPVELALAYGRRLVRRLHGVEAAPELPPLYMGHTGGLLLPGLQRIPLLSHTWRVIAGVVAAVLAFVGTTSGILDLPSFPRMLRDRAPIIRCVYPNPLDSNKLAIAFQPLTVVDESGAAVRSSAGRAVAEFLYQRFGPALADLDLDVPYEVRPPTLACALPGRTAEERAAAAAAYAERINADILVYGVITDTRKTDPTGTVPSRLELAFYIGYSGSDNENELSGPYALGEPLPITLPFDPESLLAIEHPPHLVRMNVLAELVVGLSYLSADNPEKALTYIRQAEENAHWPSVDGKEFAYLLLGHALVRQASITGQTDSLQEALTAYDRALTIQPGYIRAQLGRASCLAMLSVAERGDDGLRRLDRGRLEEARAAYEAVLTGSAGRPDEQEVSAAHAGLGYVYLTSGLYGQPADFERARGELQTVIERYEAGETDSAKSAGLAYGYLGLLARQQGDLTTAAAHYKRAADLVAPVSRALYLFRLGELACQQGEYNAALALNQRAIDDARLYGRAAEVDEYTRRLRLMQDTLCP